MAMMINIATMIITVMMIMMTIVLMTKLTIMTMVMSRMMVMTMMMMLLINDSNNGKNEDNDEKLTRSKLNCGITFSKNSEQLLRFFRKIAHSNE